jgi:hypothetical protein
MHFMPWQSDHGRKRLDIVLWRHDQNVIAVILRPSPQRGRQTSHDVVIVVHSLASHNVHPKSSATINDA